MVPGYLNEGAYSVRATAYYNDSDNISISALASEPIAVNERFGWFGIMDMILFMGTWFVPMLILTAIIILTLAACIRRRSRLKVRIVRIKKEDVELSGHVARLLQKYSRLQKQAEHERAEKARLREERKRARAAAKAKELVGSMRADLNKAEKAIDRLGNRGMDVSALKREAEKIRHTLNFGPALGSKALRKTRKRVDALRKKSENPAK
jgi:ABC-type multidrug transport system fused ATPase/permease subunit